MSKGASATQTGPSQAEPEVSALRASVPCAGKWAIVAPPKSFKNQALYVKQISHAAGRNEVCFVDGAHRRAVGIVALFDTERAAAIAMETQRAETARLGAKPDSAGPKDIAQGDATPPSSDHLTKGNEI